MEKKILEISDIEQYMEYQYDIFEDKFDKIIFTDKMTSLEGIRLKSEQFKLSEKFEYGEIKFYGIYEGCKLNHSFYFSRKEIEISLPDGIKKIPDYFCQGFYNLRHINLPDSIEEIGDSAFLCCDNLILDSLPKNLKKIGSYAFVGPIIKENIEFPKMLREIGDFSLYENCPLNRNFFLPKTVEKIGIHFFNKRYANVAIDSDNSYFQVKQDGIYSKDGKTLYMMTISDSRLHYKLDENVEKIMPGAFMECALPSVDFHSGIRELPEKAFEYAYINEVILPDNIEKIGAAAFKRCNIDYLKLPEKIKRIENSNFERANIRNLELHDGIEEIGENAFFGSDIKRYTLPKNLKIIERRAFSNIKYLYQMELPENVESLGEECFAASKGLAKITLPKKLRMIGSACFRNCRSLAKIDLPEGLEELGKNAFFDTNIRELSLPRNLKRLGDGLFSNLKRLCMYDSLREPFEVLKRNLTHVYSGFFFSNFHSLYLTIKSAETDKVLYEFYYVPLKGTDSSAGWKREIDKSVHFFKEDYTFDFEKYDLLFHEIPYWDDKLKLALSRLRKPYELTSEAKRRYEHYLESLQEDKDRVADLVMKEIKQHGIERVRMYLKYKVLDGKSFEEVVERFLKRGKEKEVMTLIKMRRETMDRQEEDDLW